MIVAYFKVLSYHLPEGADEKYKKGTYLRQLVSRIRFKPPKYEGVLMTTISAIFLKKIRSGTHRVTQNSVEGEFFPGTVHNLMNY
jgi:hypothetical protein